MPAIASDIVLLGAGSAHLALLRRFARRPLQGGRLTLVSAEPDVPYPGLLPALLRGERSVAEACIDLGPLAVAAGARLILADPIGIDLRARRLSLARRPALAFDLLSVDLEAESVVPDASLYAIPLQPLGGLLPRLAVLESALPAGARVAIVGGGTAGPELALALARRWRGRLRLVLVSDAPEPLAAAPGLARRAVRAALVEAGVELVSGVQAGALEDARLALSDGSFLDAQAAVWAGVTEAPAFLTESGLACDAAGRVVVDAAHRSTSHTAVFAVGDCVAPNRDGPGASSRASRGLSASLRRAARGKPPPRLPPHGLPRWAMPMIAPGLLDLGGGRAVAWFDRVAVAGAVVARCKAQLDRHHVRRYAPRPAVRPVAAPAPVAPGRAGPPALPCRADQDASMGTHAPAGSDELDHAAALTPPAGHAVVQSVACLRFRHLDDPFAFGQVAAAHALSDLYAIGAQPWTALPIIAVSGDVARRGETADMLAGAAALLAAESCVLLAGHSATAAEASLGFAVSGLTDPARQPRRSRLRPGDALVLTKPLGSGIVLAGQAAGTARAAWVATAIDVMRTSNATAGRILRQYGAGACAAVNGSGLSGHLAEMLRTAEAAATLWPRAVPVLPGAMDLLAPHGYTDLLADPQISGGLLAGVPPARAEACVVALREAGLQAAIVGLVQTAEAGVPMIRVVTD